MKILNQTGKRVSLVLGAFLWPWPLLFKKLFSRRIQALFVGILASFSVFVFVWVLFVEQNSLSNRTIASVLITPDFKVVSEGTSYKEVRLSENCQMFSAIKPSEIVDLTKSGPICKGWIQTDEMPFGIREWTASKYQVTQSSPRITNGNSRTEAWEAFVDPIPPSMSRFSPAFFLFLICQTGFYSYRRFLNRE